ncbi:UPF0481 protein At3g47200-like [Olea europaea var. sylvestris]|uniref:UPF0481 protein At3g47200-like n=1 Tax=Olea europaea var. sylvestris TaxID=158386 RepID=UPI000C1D8241|nr:UPF0481 protein At3g47200-like [Olea europaea var. sylvestris]
MRSKGMTTIGAKGESPSAEITQSGAKSQESRDEWLISIENCNVDETTKKSQIEKVPSTLRHRHSNEDCFDPIVVSIGPYHHEKSELKAFEELKIPIAKKFCRDHGNQLSIEQLYEVVEKVGKSARECYAKGSTERYDDESFNRMMFLDACFVLHFVFILREENVSNWKEMEQEVDPRQYSDYYQILVSRDLILLENQIPLLVLKVLMNFMFDGKGQKKSIHNFLERYNISNSAFRELDLDGAPHLLYLLWKNLASRPITKTLKQEQYVWETCRVWETYRTVTKLESVGIYVEPSKTGNLTHAEFKSHLTFGTLTLPPIFFNDLTKPLLLNLMAYEMCPHGPSDLGITSYICLMDSLIDRVDDVKELRKRRILFNNMDSDQELAQFFNQIAKDLVGDYSIYAEVKWKVDNHCQNKVQSSIAEWMHKYFSSPWSLFAFLGAIFTLALTAVQAYFTVFPGKKEDDFLNQ